MPPQFTHLISPRLDPVFALFVGLSAAAVRIRREEKEQGRTGMESWEGFKRRVNFELFGEPKDGVTESISSPATKKDEKKS